MASPSQVTPDVPRPKGKIPEWVWWVLVAVAAGAGVATVIYLKKHATPPEPKKQTIVTSSEIPDDFFLQPSHTPEQAKAEAEAKAKEAEKAKEKAAAEEKAKAQASAKLKETPPQKVAARELFKTAEQGAGTAAPVVYQPPSDPAALFNEQRRNGGLSRVANAGRLHDAKEFVSRQEDYKDEEKTLTSFPVDLSRTITVNKNIPALLVNAINSEVEGKVVATVEENVYCSHGRNVCIPAGSQAVGRFRSLKKPGDERIEIIWARIITPDGINIHLGNAELADAMGRSGITGDVDNRFMERYGLALMVSTLSAATSMSVPVTSPSQAVIIQTYGNNISSLSNQILEKNINLKPKVSIPAGARILISPLKDIWFPKPEEGEKTIQAKSLDEYKQQKGKKL